MYAVLLTATEGCFDAVPIDKVKTVEANLLRELKHDHAKDMESINKGDEPDDKLKQTIIKLANKIAESYKVMEKVEAKK
jgi:F0F1-type ATP synthase alpha subunit